MATIEEKPKKGIAKIISMVLNIMLILTCIILSWVYKEHIPILIPTAATLLLGYMGVINKGLADKIKYSVSSVKTNVKAEIKEEIREGEHV